MAARQALLVLDDGELDDVVALLNELGIELTHLRGGVIPAQIAPPTRLLVTTPRRAMLAKDWPRGEPLRIAVVTEDSNTLRAMLRRVGFDLLLRRPIHPYALRLVLLRALYVGEEKRREERIPVGVEVSFRTGFRRRKALLADVSPRGCRLLSEQALSAGARITLALPKELSATGLSLPTKVVRVSAKPEVDGRYEVGLAFESLSKERHQQLRALLKQLSDAAGIEDPRALAAKTAGRAAAAAQPLANGPAGATAPPTVRPTPTAKLPPGARQSVARAPIALPPRRDAAAEDAESDRRKHQRGVFEREVAKLDDEASSVLLGRDLSIGGMRVEYHPNLRLGDLLQLALYVSPREEPLVVKARVVQDAGSGLGLAFEGVDPELAARLERVVARLPIVESLQAGEAAGLGSVVTRVLSGFQQEV